MPLLFIFFFQAEDGIRDLTVTGVQTCALPILVLVVAQGPAHVVEQGAGSGGLDVDGQARAGEPAGDVAGQACPAAQVGHEEIGRACVGKEWRSRWSPYDEKEKVGGGHGRSEGV